MPEAVSYTWRQLMGLVYVFAFVFVFWCVSLSYATSCVLHLEAAPLNLKHSPKTPSNADFMALFLESAMELRRMVPEQGLIWMGLCLKAVCYLGRLSSAPKFHSTRRTHLNITCIFIWICLCFSIFICICVCVMRPRNKKGHLCLSLADLDSAPTKVKGPNLSPMQILTCGLVN